MSNLNTDDRKEKGSILGNSWRDFRNFILLKNRAGRCAALGLLVFAAWNLIVTRNPISLVLPLILFMSLIVAYFLGAVAKYLRKAILGPNAFRSASEAEDYMDEPIDQTEKKAEPEEYLPSSDEEREFLRKL